MRAIIHAGVHKTGTTSIQASLEKSVDLLRNQGIRFPIKGGYNHTSVLADAFKPFRTTQAENPAQCRPIDDFIPPQDGSIHTVIFSAEGLSNFNHESRLQFARWLREHFDEIQYIVYTREPLGFASSMAQERLKTYLGETIGEVVEIPPLVHYRGIIENWIKDLAPDDIRVFDFKVASQSENGLFHHFCAQCGIEMTESIAANEIRENSSLSLPGAYMLSALNTFQPVKLANGLPNPVRDETDHRNFTQIGGPKFRLPIETEKFVLERLHDEILWLDKEFGISYQNIEIDKEVERVNLKAAKQPEWFLHALNVLEIGETDKLELENDMTDENILNLPVKDIVDQIKAADPQLEGLPGKRGVRVVKTALGKLLDELDTIEEGAVRVPGFGTFRVVPGVAEGDDKKTKRIVFRPAVASVAE